MGPVDRTGVESSVAERTKSVEQDDSMEDDERAQRAVTAALRAAWSPYGPAFLAKGFESQPLALR
jgi:hypothetical protein